MSAPKTYLKPEILARLRGLELCMRTTVSGRVAGMHRSRYRGFSVEFAEHRQYVSGDDIRYLDWRLLGRSDRLYVKQYEAETNLHCVFLLDASSSMNYRGTSARESKYDYAATLTAALACLVLQQQDAAGLLTFARRPGRLLSPGTGRRQLRIVLDALADRSPESGSSLQEAAAVLAGELRRQSLIVIISDLLLPFDEVAQTVELLSRAGHEAIVMHVMDDDEWHFPLIEHTRFEDFESDDFLVADPQALRASYLAAVADFQNRVSSLCLRHGADYVAMNTRQPVDANLAGYLTRRAGRRYRGSTTRR